MKDSFLAPMQTPSVDEMSKEAYEAKGAWESKGSFFYTNTPMPKRREGRFPFTHMPVGKSFVLRKNSIFFNAATSSADATMRRYNLQYRIKFVKIKHPEHWEYARIG